MGLIIYNLNDIYQKNKSRWSGPALYIFYIQKRNQLYQNVFQFNFILFSERFIDDENVVDSRLLPKIYKELMSASHANIP